MATQNIYDFYIEHVKKYKEEYGEKTVVFIQVGSFFEIYDDGSNTVDIRRIAEVLDIIVSRRNKNIQEVSRNNVLMAGVPLWAKSKYFNNLVNHQGYTVVVMEQVSDPPNPIRRVTEILSPGIPLQEGSQRVSSNYVACIYIEDIKLDHTGFGFAAIDVLTGKSLVAENTSITSNDELYRLVASTHPREVIVMGTTTSRSFKDIVNLLDLKGVKVHDKLNIFDRELTRPVYQETLFRKVFKDTGLLSAIEYLDLERMTMARVALAYLIKFTHHHNETILDLIDKPRIVSDAGYLRLSHNAATKLDIIGSENTLMTILSASCRTSIGRRLFKERLLNPVVSADELNHRYDTVEDIIRTGQHEVNTKCLGSVCDLERLFRRICTKKMHPAEWSNIDISLKNTLMIPSIDAKLTSKVKDLVSYYSRTLNLSVIDKFHLDNIDASFFTDEHDVEICKLQKQLTRATNLFQDAVSALNAKVGDGMFKLEHNDRDGYYLLITQKRHREASDKIQDFLLPGIDVPYSDINVKPVSSTSSACKLSHIAFENLNKEINNLKVVIRRQVLDAYFALLEEISHGFKDTFKKIIEFVGDIDVMTANAINALKYRYVRPVVDEAKQQVHESYVSLKEVRHPIIERIIDVPYITNDVYLGTDSTGMLLYGTNATGKSSLGKAVALSIIMAQSGMFVPAREMTFYPYKTVFARIPTGDDLFKGHSTFVVEMLELRNILLQADANSFCISDELCNGTESISGAGIVAAVIERLCNVRCSFITASHLHDVADMKCIRALNNLRICHLEVRYDEANRRLVYDRILKDGCGSTVYGLEVCKSLNLPDEFLTRANDIRASLMNDSSESLAAKKSRYNSQVFFDTCGVCSAKAEEIHHIKHQCTADSSGFVGHMHKNNRANLCGLCSKCHDDVHSGILVIEGFSTTDNGRKLIYTCLEKNEEESSILDTIAALRKNKTPQTKIIEVLKSKYPSVKFTPYKLRKYVQQLYIN
jgi:DNA mismatch repair protein MutS